ncbi:MAG: hypothetical protein J6S78_03425 [Lachnospiraceae bacterium]|nr:hypothetical protein [Lachnospiraceae bacterium]
MKIYDETGRYIGSVRKEELINAEEAIMPVSIAVTPAKEIALPDGFLIMAIGSMVACISMLLTFLSEQVGFSYDADGILDYFGLYGTRAVLFVPLAAFIHLAAGIILAHRCIAFLAFAFIHMLGIIRVVTTLDAADPYLVTTLDAAALDVLAIAVLGYVLQKKYSVRLYYFLLAIKVFFIMIFSIPAEARMGRIRILMFIYYLIESGFWLYMFLRIRRREKK